VGHGASYLLEEKQITYIAMNVTTTMHKEHSHAAHGVDAMHSCNIPTAMKPSKSSSGDALITPQRNGDTPHGNLAALKK
jgi:hypothetical protein